MGEQGAFVSWNLNSQQDIETAATGLAPQIAKSGEGLNLAVAAWVSAAQAGDAQGVAEAKTAIAQYFDQLEALGKEKVKLNEYSHKAAKSDADSAAKK